MVALAGEGRGLHLAQQRVHLLEREAAPRAHAAVAGDAGQDQFQGFRQAQGVRRLGEVGGEVAQELGEMRAYDL